MARTKRSAKLDTRSARLLLASGKRHQSQIEPGRYLIYQRPKNLAAGSWLARWADLTADKQRQYKLGTADDYSEADGARTLSWKQANEKAGVWFKAQDETARREAGGEAVNRGPFTVNDALDLYFQDGERRGVKGLSRDIQRAGAWIRPELGVVGVATLTRKRIESWQTKVAESPRRVRTKSPSDPGESVPKPREFKIPRTTKPSPSPPEPPSTDEEKRARKDSANRVLTVLKAALNHALDRREDTGVTNGDAWLTVKPYRETTKARIRFLDQEDQVSLVKACLPDFRRLVQGGLLTGARYSELARVQAGDFNSMAGTVFIAESKSGLSRHVALTEEGRTFFSRLTTGKAAGELVFLRDSALRKKRIALGNTWGHGDTARLMREACKSANLEPLTFHELRHSYASMLVNRGVPLLYVATQLGHSNTRMVEKHYGHLAPNALADSIRNLVPILGILGN